MIWTLSRSKRCGTPEPYGARAAPPALVLLTVALFSCEGVISRASASSPGPQQPPVQPTEATGPRALTRLTRQELLNTLDALSSESLGISPAQLPNDTVGDFGFETDVPLSASTLSSLVDVVAAAAPQLRGQWQARLPACAAQDEDCARTFIEQFGLRAYRRPLSTTDVEARLADYRTARSTWAATHAEALDFVVQTICLSPYFLYHSERVNDVVVADARGWVALDAYEIASRLSFSLWKSAPDDALLQAAASGDLLETATIAAQAERLMGDARFKNSLGYFVTTWAGIADAPSVQKDRNKFPAFNPELAADFLTESQRLASFALWGEGGSFKRLLEADSTFVNSRLAAFYGLPEIMGTQWVKATLDPKERSGLFTQGAFLSSHALPNGNSPPRRGKYLADRVLCAPVSPPPPSVSLDIPPAQPGQTTRQVFADATAGSNCSGCHVILNAVGFAFEMYDSTGALQRTEAGNPIDASGGFDGISFDAAPQLLRRATARTATATCISKELFRSLMQRTETPGELAQLSEVAADFQKTDMAVMPLISTLVKSSSFRFRTKADGEH